jgi:WD40 repeat protein
MKQRNTTHVEVMEAGRCRGVVSPTLSMFTGSAEEPTVLHCHSGYDQSGTHSCTIFNLDLIIPSIDFIKFNSRQYIVFADQTIVKLLDPQTQETSELKGHRSPILSVKCCGEHEIVTMSRDGGINIWNPWELEQEQNTTDGSGGLVWKNSLTGSRYNLTSLSVSSREDGVLIVTTADGYLCAWNRGTYLPIHTSQIDSRGLFSSAICDTNKLLLVGGYGRLHIHDEDFHSFSHVTTLGGHSGPIFTVIAANGYVATGGEDKLILVHQLNNFQVVASRPNAHLSAVTALLHHPQIIPRDSFSSSSSSAVPLTYLISGGRDNHIHVMTFPTLELLFTITGHEGRITSLALAPEYHNHQGRSALLSCSADNTLKVWKIYRTFNWERRKAFLMLLVSCGYVQLSLMRALQLLSSDNTAEKRNGLSCEEPTEARRRREVFSNKGILRAIVAFV